MAPWLAKKAEASLSISESSSLAGSLGSVVPVVLMILLLLLCFSRRKKRQLSTRVLKGEQNVSELLHLAKLEDESCPERKSREDENMLRGNAPAPHQGERQPNTNGVAAEARHESGNSPEGMCVAVASHPRAEMPPKLEVELLRGFGVAQTLVPPNATASKSVQLRKLPMTPKEAHISRMKPPDLRADDDIYESIRLKDTDLYSRIRLAGTKGSAVPSGGDPKGARLQEDLLEGSEGSGRTDSWTSESNGAPVESGASVPSDPSSGQLRETQPETEAPRQPVSASGKRLSTLYARVCKKPKASPQPQTPNQDKATGEEGQQEEEEEEEKPPPIPEKHFENVYESLCLEAEGQGDEIPDSGKTSPPEGQDC